MSGYAKPNYTQMPNLLLDEHLREMGEAELKVCIAIARKTFGWHKERDRISLSQFVELTGLSRQGVINGIEAAMKRGLLGREKSGQSYTYFLLVNDVDQPTSQPSRPETSQPSRHTKETKKEKEEHEGQPDPVIRAYEQMRGTFNPLEIEKLLDLVEDWRIHSEKLPVKHPDYLRPADEVVIEAIHITATSADKPNLRYVTAVVENWMRHGFGNDGRKKRQGKQPETDYTAEAAKRKAEAQAIWEQADGVQP